MRFRVFSHFVFMSECPTCSIFILTSIRSTETTYRYYETDSLRYFRGISRLNFTLSWYFKIYFGILPFCYFQFPLCYSMYHMGNVSWNMFHTLIVHIYMFVLHMYCRNAVLIGLWTQEGHSSVGSLYVCWLEDEIVRAWIVFSCFSVCSNGRLMSL